MGFILVSKNLINADIKGLLFTTGEDSFLRFLWEMKKMKYGWQHFSVSLIRRN